MKLVKTLIIAVVLLAVNYSNAQLTSSNWKELNTVNEVIQRMANSADQGNIAPVRHFSKTLNYTTSQLTAKAIPAVYKSAAKQSAIKQLQQKAAELESISASKASDKEILSVFNEIQGIYAIIADVSTPK